MYKKYLYYVFMRLEDLASYTMYSVHIQYNLFLVNNS